MIFFKIWVTTGLTPAVLFNRCLPRSVSNCSRHSHDAADHPDRSGKSVGGGRDSRRSRTPSSRGGRGPAGGDVIGAAAAAAPALIPAQTFVVACICGTEFIRVLHRLELPLLLHRQLPLLVGLELLLQLLHAFQLRLLHLMQN